MRCSVIQSNSMAKKTSPYNRGEKPMSFRQAIELAANTPHLTHKQIDELRKKEKLLNKSKK